MRKWTSSKHGQLDDESFERLHKFALALLSDRSAYHNAKETMAHAALLLEVAIFGYVMTVTEWPPRWLREFIPMSWSIVAIVFAACWLLHVYIRWQLRNRRWAAEYRRAIVTKLGEWNVQRPAREDVNPSASVAPTSAAQLWFAAIDRYVWPLKNGGPIAGEPGVPVCLRARELGTTEAIKAERIVTLSSIVMIAAIVVRTYFALYADAC